jgi:VWFA-related protein
MADSRGFAFAVVCTLTAVFVAAPRGDIRLDVRGQFKSSAEAVRIDVLVTSRGKAVRGLTALDFELRDEGVVQRVEHLDLEQLPVNVICVFDTSSSVAGELLENLVQAGSALLGGLKEGDRAGVVAFSNRVRLVSALTGDHAAVRAALESLKASGRTTLRDGLFAGIALRELDTARSLVLLFSDGRDTASWTTTARVMDALRRTDVVVYPVAVKPVPASPPRGAFISPSFGQAAPRAFDPGPFLEDVARESGGRIVVAEDDQDLGPAFQSILSEFRDRYVLTYVPTGVHAGGWHRVDVKLNGKRGTVTARRGYFSQ